MGQPDRAVTLRGRVAQLHLQALAFSLRVAYTCSTMSERSSSDFIHLPRFDEFVMCQEFEQKLAIMGFYRAYCKTRYETSDAHLDGRQGKFPTVLGKIWTVDETLYALNAAPSAREDPADYLLMAAQSRENIIQTDELEILRVRHVKPADNPLGLDKIIDATWHETGKHVIARFGRAASILTRDADSNLVYSPALPLD